MAKKNAKKGKKGGGLSGGRLSSGAYAGLRPRDAQLIQSQTDLAYGPKQTALQALVTAAQEQKKSDVRGAKTTAKAIVRASNKAIKPTEQIFAQSDSDADTAAADVRAAFSNIGAAADPYRTSTEREIARQQTRIASQRGRTLSDLTQRKVEARAGREGAITQARSDYKQNMKQLGTQLVALAGERGTYAATQAGTLAGDRAKTKADIRKSKIAAQGQKDVAGIYAGAKGKGGSSGSGSGSGSDSSGTAAATPTTIRGFRDSVAEAMSKARKLQAGAVGKSGKQKRAPMARAQAHDTMIDALGIDDTAAKVALDVVYGKKLSPSNVRMLRDLGLSPARLGLGKYLPGTVEARGKRTRARGNRAQQQYYEGPGGAYG